MRRFYWVVRDGLYHSIVGQNLHISKKAAQFWLGVHNDRWTTPKDGYIQRVEIKGVK